MIWSIAVFTDVVKDVTSGNAKIKQSDYRETGTLPIIDQGQEFFGGYIDDASLACKAQLPVVIFGDHTRVLKFVDTPFALGADGVKVLKPSSEKLDEKFLYHFLRQARIPDNAGYSRHFKFLKRLKIPLPPLKEQKRIAAILDKADAIRRKRQQAIELTDQFLRSVFLNTFGDPTANTKDWKVRPLGEIGEIITGNTPSRNHPEYYGNYIEWIKSDNINTSGHFLTTAFEGLSEDGARRGRVARSGSVLVTCIAGSKDCIGNVAIANRAVAFNQQINAIVPLACIDFRYLYTLLLVGKR